MPLSHFLLFSLKSSHVEMTTYFPIIYSLIFFYPFVFQ
ncbi:Uncharacterised protein [Vibrio cholerae]|nr:Uncharacterised protein [Vibrio cholerae]